MFPIITLIGLLNWQQANRPTTWLDVLQLPNELDLQYNRQVILAHIEREASELECTIPEPDKLTRQIAHWSAARLPSWERMLIALTKDYNPAENYDRIDERTIITDDDRSGLSHSHNSIQYTGTNTVRTEGQGSVTDTGSTSTENTVVGYNDMTPVQRPEGGSTVTPNLESRRETDDTTTTTRNLLDSGEQTTLRTDAADIKVEDTLRSHGNIGVMLAATGVLAELDLRVTDILSTIAQEIVDTFTLGIY